MRLSDVFDKGSSDFAVNHNPLRRATEILTTMTTGIVPGAADDGAAPASRPPARTLA